MKWIRVENCLPRGGIPVVGWAITRQGTEFWGEMRYFDVTGKWLIPGDTELNLDFVTVTHWSIPTNPRPSPGRASNKENNMKGKSKPGKTSKKPPMKK